jgi:hypothetical protein
MIRAILRIKRRLSTDVLGGSKGRAGRGKEWNIGGGIKGINR